VEGEGGELKVEKSKVRLRSFVYSSALMGQGVVATVLATGRIVSLGRLSP
jgi:hypothetical protein